MKCKKLAVLIMAGVLAVSALVGCSSGGSEKGSADDYPSKDISVIIPKAAGGGTDTAARGLMQYMKENLEGSNFVATNKPDGGGVTGMVETSAAKADAWNGYSRTFYVPMAGQMSGYTGRLRSNLCSDCCAGGIDCTGRFSI